MVSQLISLLFLALCVLSSGRHHRIRQERRRLPATAVSARSTQLAGTDNGLAFAADHGTHERNSSDGTDCSLLGLSPGMPLTRALRHLGEPTAVHASEPSADDQSRQSLYEWHNGARDVSIEATRSGEIIAVTLALKRGTAVGPFGVRIGVDCLTKAIQRIGAEYVEGVHGASAGTNPIAWVTIGCGAEGSTVVEYYVRLSQPLDRDASAVPTASLRRLLAVAGDARVISARLSY